MTFSEIIGHEDIKKVLTGMADSARVPHAMLFYENEGCGALPLALAFVQYLNCRHRQGGDSCGDCPSCNKVTKLIHPDLHFVYPVTGGSKIDSSAKPTSDSYLKYWRELVVENPYFLENELYTALGIEKKSGSIQVAESKIILDKLSLASVEDGYKAIIIWLPEKIRTEAANKLLKILEEPTEKTIFILITHAPESVLQTIFSRCQSLRIPPQPKEDVEEALVRAGVSPEEAAVYSGICGGSIGKALSLIREKEEDGGFLDLFSDLVGAAVNKDLLAALEAGEAIAALDSREKQKAFCNFAGECVRKMFLTGRGLESIAALTPHERAFFEQISGKVRQNFCSRALGYFDKAAELLSANVNAKIIFCDLANRIYLSV